MEARNRISEPYREQQQWLHQNPLYGVASLHFAPMVLEILRANRLQSISDYGAGKQRLREELQRLGARVDYHPYDPAFPEYGEPRPADLVCCIDVLEHVEMDCIDSVLLDLRDITPKLGFFTVHTGPAGKTLPDGRNAHLIQRPSSWWLPKLCEHFEIVQLNQTEDGFWVIVMGRGA